MQPSVIRTVALLAGRSGHSVAGNNLRPLVIQCFGAVGVDERKGIRPVKKPSTPIIITVQTSNQGSPGKCALK